MTGRRTREKRRKTQIINQVLKSEISMEKENVKENETQKEQVLSNEEHHLLDLFAPINR